MLVSHRRIAAIERDRDRALEKLEAQISAAFERRDFVKMSALRDQADQLEAKYASMIKEGRAKIEDRETKERQAQQVSQDKRLAIEKARAKAAWRANGGDPDAFDAAWPDLARQLVEQKTLEDLLTEKPARLVNF